jgi:Uma2 family endonuclease
MTVDAYLAGPEQLTPSELVFGAVREPPAPRYGHQAVVTRALVLLDAHVRGERLGAVCVAPVDVVLDRPGALVLQPDIVFVAADRAGIIDDRIWGAPDLVVEVLSRRTAERDRTTKLDLYGRFGVRECWLVDPGRKTVDVVRLGTAGERRWRSYRDQEPVRSGVLPLFSAAAADFFN